MNATAIKLAADWRTYWRWRQWSVWCRGVRVGPPLGAALRFARRHPHAIRCARTLAEAVGFAEYRRPLPLP